MKDSNLNVKRNLLDQKNSNNQKRDSICNPYNNDWWNDLSEKRKQES
jgi:hypothetical protein